jgi:uncharacterized membrane protein YdjX (TVP38/TMEM64 family)
MDWLAPVVLKVMDLGPWAPALFVLLYVAAAVTLAPAFFLTVASGALFGVWRGSLIVFVGASLGSAVVYALASPLADARWIHRVTRDPRVAAVRTAIAGGGVRIMLLLRLSPVIPYNVLNYALALSGVRFRDYGIGLFGMVPAIIMYTYYGKVVGDVAALAAGVAPPRGVGYYTLMGVGLVAIAVSTTMIARTARREMERHRPMASHAQRVSGSSEA